MRLYRFRLNVSRDAASVVRVDEFLPLESLDILSGPPIALECDEKTFQAAVVAFAIALKTKGNILATVSVGMLALHALTALRAWLFE